jgi:hypothetical protein
MATWSKRIHATGVQSKWLLSSDHWELLHVFSLPEIKYCNWDWMTVFSSNYPSTTWKVCVDMFACMIACVNSHTTAQMRARAQWHRQFTVEHWHDCCYGGVEKTL